MGSLPTPKLQPGTMPPKRQYKEKWPGQEPDEDDRKRQETDSKSRTEMASSSCPDPRPSVGKADFRAVPPPSELLMDIKSSDVWEFEQQESIIPPRTPTPESSDHGDEEKKVRSQFDPESTLFSKDNFEAAAEAEEKGNDIDKALATSSQQQTEDIKVMPIAGQPRGDLEEND